MRQVRPMRCVVRTIIDPWNNITIADWDQLVGEGWHVLEVFLEQEVEIQNQSREGSISGLYN